MYRCALRPREHWDKHINDSSQHYHLLTHVAAEAIQDRPKDPTKFVFVPATNQGPYVTTQLLKLNARVGMSVRPSEDLDQLTGVLAVEEDRVKVKQKEKPG